MKQYRRSIVLVLLGLLLGAVALVEAQQHRVQSRAKVWDVFWNNGIQGVNEATILTYYRPLGFSYPGQFWTQVPGDFIEYWGVRFWSGASQWLVWEHELTALMPGFNTFVVSRDPTDSAGEFHVSESKPVRTSTDVVAMAYDPSQGPEKNIGYANPAPLGPMMGNWWPGQLPPGQDVPVEIQNYRYFNYMEPDKDMFPENTIAMQWTTKRGLQVTKKVLSWSYPEYDDFQILEYEIENTGDSDGDGVADVNGGAGLQLNDTFLVFSVIFHVSQNGHAWQHYDNWYRNAQRVRFDDWNKYTEAANYDGWPVPGGQTLKMWYTHDADDPLSANDDLGQPYLQAQSRWHNRIGGVRKEGELTGYQYAGFAPLAYTPGAANDPVSWTYDSGGDAGYVAPKVADQPFALRWWDFRNRGDYDEPDSDTNTFQEMFNLLAGSEPFIQDNPTEVDRVHTTFAYGPYDLAVGQKAKVVVALVAGAPVEDNIWGWAKKGLQDDMRTDRAWKNLVKHFNAARDAYNWGYDVPDPPPDVKVTSGASPDGFNMLTWPADADNATDPDYTGAEAQDVVGYRVYRSEFKIDDWQLLDEFEKGDPQYLSNGTYSYKDTRSIAGFTYFYNVRTYDSGHSDWNGTGKTIPSLESGHSSPEQWANGVKFDSPFVPAQAATDGLQRQVTVVPNPYREDGAHAYPSKGQIRFTNIPHKCTIQIFTPAGDLMTTINHDDPTRGEVTWAQLSDDFVESASSGVYYFIVQSLVATSQGKRQRGAFMIVK